MIKKINKPVIFLCLIILLASCSKNVVYTDLIPMKGNTWAVDNPASFIFTIDDTITSNNIHFIIRTGSSYPYRNIYLFVTTTSPAYQSITDTLQYDLADEKGNWYGRGAGDIRELSLNYKSNIFFPTPGEWKINVQHGMRLENLGGIYDFGLRIEKNPN